jgi:hypothetical protein
MLLRPTGARVKRRDRTGARERLYLIVEGAVAVEVRRFHHRLQLRLLLHNKHGACSPPMVARMPH